MITSVVNTVNEHLHFCAGMLPANVSGQLFGIG